eukprot:365431-Chlamydomonas_euryale.AAC.5
MLVQHRRDSSTPVFALCSRFLLQVCCVGAQVAVDDSTLQICWELLVCQDGFHQVCFDKIRCVRPAMTCACNGRTTGDV